MFTGYCYATPLGPLSVIQDGKNILSAGFQGLEEQSQYGPYKNVAEKKNTALSERLDAYFSGESDALQGVPVTQSGTPLQEEVWQALAAIPLGEVLSYKKLAEQTSKPKAIRAVASACGKNNVVLFVPCHRAVRSNGSLGGYLYGIAIKKALLSLEK